MITFDEARKAVFEDGAALWDELDLEGEYYVAGYGWEDADGFLMVEGAKEWLVDGDEEFMVWDADAVFVDKATGTVLRAVFIEMSERIAQMSPVGDHPEE